MQLCLIQFLFFKQWKPQILIPPIHILWSLSRFEELMSSDSKFDLPFWIKPRKIKGNDTFFLSSVKYLLQTQFENVSDSLVSVNSESTINSHMSAYLAFSLFAYLINMWLCISHYSVSTCLSDNISLVILIYFAFSTRFSTNSEILRGNMGSYLSFGKIWGRVA